jgi:hypothetical protein
VEFYLDRAGRFEYVTPLPADWDVLELKSK